MCVVVVLLRYRVNVTEIEGITQSHDVEHVILDGHHTQYFLDEFAGEPIIPGEQFNIIVEYVCPAHLVCALPTCHLTT